MEIFSYPLKMTVEFSIDILSYNRTREYLQYLELKPSGNLTKPLSILHFLTLS